MLPDLFPEGSLVSPVYRSVKSNVQVKMSMERQRNDTDRRKLKYSEKNQSNCHFEHRKLNTDWPGIGPGPSQWWKLTG